MSIKTMYKDSEDEVVDLLRNNIRDPLGINRQTGCPFVDHGKGSHDGKTPRILVQKQRESSNSYIGIGESNQDLSFVYSITIEVAPSAGGEVNGIRKTGPELLNILCGEVAEVMQNNVHPVDNNSNTIIKQIKRLSGGSYDFNPVTNVHYNIQLYEVLVLND